MISMLPPQTKNANNMIQSSVPLKITSSGKDVLNSESIVTFGNAGLEITLSNLIYHIKFGNDSSVPRMELKAINPHTAELYLWNFDNPLPTGTTVPSEVGIFGGRKLYLAFMCHGLGTSGVKLINFTFYLGENV